MTWPIFYKLLAIVLVAALGWVVGRTRWLGDAQVDPARVLANTAFYLFAPALFFAKRAGLQNPPQYYNNWAGSVGGPIRKDKTFFWFSTEDSKPSL